MSNNYTLGRGEIFFARFADGTQTPGGERYLGNTPEFNLTIEEEKLEHFSSDRGIREKDDSVSLQVNRTGTLTTDNIDPKNVALFFFGDQATVADAGGALEETLEGVEQGLYYQLGVDDDNPAGRRGLDVDPDGSDIGVVVYAADESEGAAFTYGDDYTVEASTGRIYIVPGGAIVDGTDITVETTVQASTRSRVISGSQPVAGSMRYVARNPKGDQIDYFFPYVQISPNGDYALKSDEWQQIPFNIEVLKKEGFEAIYAEGRAVFA